MKLIVSHASPDFDALASIALAELVYPGAKAVRLGNLGVKLETFLHLYRNQLDLLNVEKINLADVKELIIVDTSDPKRIAPFDQLLGKVPVTLYDHHPPPKNAIPAVHGICRSVGATTTILTLLLKSQGITIPRALASLALLGIHEDTGNLTYEITQPEDHEAAAYLLQAGASLNLVQRFTQEHYSEAHRKLFADMLEHTEEKQILGCSVVLSQIKTETYVNDLAPLCNQLLAFYNADAAFIIARMEDKTLIIGRSIGHFDVGSILADAFAGGGHQGAGFARTEASISEAKARILETLPQYGQAPILAKDVMSSPIKTIYETDAVAKAQSLLLRYGHSGLPVLNNKGELSGVISRRDLDKAIQHKMGHKAVKGFMNRKPITAAQTTPLSELEYLIEHHNIGRIPILEMEESSSKLVGIVTRSDIIRARHQNEVATLSGSGSQQKARELLLKLPRVARKALEIAKEQLSHGNLYLVGGTVRDAVLGVSIQDIDLTVEGISSEQLATRLQHALEGELNCHSSFGTCTLKLKNGLVLDIATARDEYYQHPGALPEVISSSLYKDINRRDFSINALAIRLGPEPIDLIDPHNGLNDLETKSLRALHPLSFIEDPTRIIRGARLAGRLNLNFDETTLDQLPAALAPEVLANISKSRLRAELEITLQETRVTPALLKLEETGALKAMFGMSGELSLLERLDKLRHTSTVPIESYLLALLLSILDDELESYLESFHWPKRYLEIIKRIKTIREHNNVTHEQVQKSSEGGLMLIRALSRELEARVFEIQESLSERVLRGQDILDLGLSTGPKVGVILAEVAKARHEGRVSGFLEELELARELVKMHLNQAD